MRKVFSLLFIVATIFCSSCSDKIKPGSIEPKRKEVSGVTISTIAPSLVDHFYETSGTVKAKNTGVISSRLMGTVTKVIVKEGDKVQAGDTLILIDDSDAAQRSAAAVAGYIEAQKALEAAMNNKMLAEITYQRYSKLHEEKVISQQEFDQIETRNKIARIEYERMQHAVERARAQQEEARAYHGFTRIKAPYGGIVTAKKIDAGSMAVPGVPLLVVEDVSQFKIEVSADERLYKNLSVGADVSIFIGSTNEKIKGRISRIAPAVDPSTRTFNVEILIKGAALRTGLYAKVMIPEGRKETILIPKNTIVEKGQLTGVYKVSEKDIISYNLVKTGKHYGEDVEVLSGLKKGDRIITGGVEKAIDGGIVKETGGKPSDK